MGGKRGYGPTHSQSYERLFMGVPYLDIIAINKRVDPFEIYSNVFNELTTATLVIENKIDYAQYLNAPVISTHEYSITTDQYPCLIITPKSVTPELTVFCYGGNLGACEDAVKELFLEDEIFATLICPTQIQPLNIAPVLESVKKTGKLVIIEEGPGFAALGSELAAALIENGAVFQLARLSNHNIIPSSFKAELNLLPEKQKIKNLIKKTI
jgi:2-oxoisovalerate dehydrogenase E1 component